MHVLLDEWRSLDLSLPTLRRFGWTVGAVFLALAALVLWKHGGTPTAATQTLGIVGAALVALGTAWPQGLRQVYRVWMLLAVALGFVMTRVILTVVFALVVTPLGVVRRALGHDPMRRRRPDRSLWIACPDDPNDDPRRRMERTF